MSCEGSPATLSAFDPGTEVPPIGLLPSGRRRPAPFLYSDADIAALMAAAKGVGLPLRSATLEAVIGLLATTGLRVGEVAPARLRRRGPRAWNPERAQSKQGRSRLVPLHQSTVEALRVYVRDGSELMATAGLGQLLRLEDEERAWAAGNLREAFNRRSIGLAFLAESDVRSAAGRLPPHLRCDRPCSAGIATVPTSWRSCPCSRRSWDM